MAKKGLNELIGVVLEHKTLGPCEVVEVHNAAEGKFTGKVVATGEMKRLVFASQFFLNVDEYDTVEVKVQKKNNQQRVHKKVDLDKYRNHPLVKQIDKQEAGYRPRSLYDEEVLLTEELDDTEDEEIVA